MDKKAIIDRINTTNTKGSEYFQRFYENHTDLFWRFYELNHTTGVDTSSESEFQTLGEKVEMELRKLENILTSRQLGGVRSTEKTVTAFYDLAESYFPLYGMID